MFWQAKHAFRNRFIFSGNKSQANGLEETCGRRSHFSLITCLSCQHMNWDTDRHCKPLQFSLTWCSFTTSPSIEHSIAYLRSTRPRLPAYAGSIARPSQGRTYLCTRRRALPKRLYESILLRCTAFFIVDT